MAKQPPKVMAVKILSDLDLNKADQAPTIEQLLIESRLNLKEPLPPPPVCIQILSDGQYIDMCTLGNFSVVIGKAKSRKTFFTNLLTAAVLNPEKSEFVKGRVCDDRRKIVWFDTEQGQYHLQKSAKRICKIIGDEDPANLAVYGLRRYTTEQRMKMIETAIYADANIFFVVIDGVRDLTLDINDPEKAVRCICEIMRWTDERNIHVVLVLHQNKADLNARGHLGTEAMNKAETVVSVTKDDKDQFASIVKTEVTRGKEFKPFLFRINDKEIPEIDTHWQYSPAKSSKKVLSPSDYPEALHQLILINAIAEGQELQYNALLRKIKTSISNVAKYVGDSKVREFIKYYLDNGWITHYGEERSKNSFYKLTLSTVLNPPNV